MTKINSLGLSRCLLPLLDALDWHGDRRSLIEAQPHLITELDELGIMNTMANLGFKTRSTKGILDRLHPNLVPCLFVSEVGIPMAIIRQENDSYMVYDGIQEKYRTQDIFGEKGTYFFFEKMVESKESPLKVQKNWFSRLLGRFRKLGLLALFLSFALALTALVTPLVIMGVYDMILTTDSISSLKWLGIGLGIYIITDAGFKLLRMYILSYGGARLSHMVGGEVLRRILYFPPAYTEGASLGAQVARIRDFSSVRSFIEGQGLVNLMELPFFLSLSIVLVLIGGNLAYIPLIAVVVFGLFGFFVVPWVRRINEEASKTGMEKQEFLLEALSSFREIRFSGGVGKWMDRYREISAKASIDNHKTSVINSLIINSSQTIVNIAGAFTIGFGVLKVINGSLSTGALLGSTILVWRILAPVKNMFTVFSQSVRIKKSVDQLNRLMGIRIENRPENSNVLSRNLRGKIRLDNVSIRYNPESHPALLGVSMTINQGEVVCLSGHDGAGKSTLIKLILGMYKPQSGRVLLDEFNIRQLDPLLLRRALAYSPQVDRLFYGTIRQNLLLSDPTASEESLLNALEMSDLKEAVDKLPKGMDTRIGDNRSTQMASSFSKRINLARMFLRKSPIILLDEPDNGLGDIGIHKLIQQINELKGDKTILIVSNHVELKECADKVINLERGRVLQGG